MKVREIKSQMAEPPSSPKSSRPAQDVALSDLRATRLEIHNEHAANAAELEGRTNWLYLILAAIAIIIITASVLLILYAH
jgi:hypothetical protein